MRIPYLGSLETCGAAHSSPGLEKQAEVGFGFGTWREVAVMVAYLFTVWSSGEGEVTLIWAFFFFYFNSLET